MKYLKHFETIQKSFNERFWLVKTKEPDLEIRLQKIGVTGRFYTSMINRIRNSYYGKEIFIKAYSYNLSNGTIKNIFEIEKYNTAIFNNLIKNNNKYMGRVEITQKDIDDWESKQMAKKYNIG